MMTSRTESNTKLGADRGPRSLLALHVDQISATRKFLEPVPSSRVRRMSTSSAQPRTRRAI